MTFVSEENLQFLEALTKLRKATTGFVMCVCPSVHRSAWPNSAPTGRTFMKFDTRALVQNLSRKFKIHFESDENRGHFTLRPKHIYHNTLLNYFYNEKCARQNLQRKSKHILCSINFFFLNRAVSDNVEKYCRDGQATDENIIRRMRITPWILRATNTAINL